MTKYSVAKIGRQKVEAMCRSVCWVMKRLVFSICRNIVWSSTQKRHCIEATTVAAAAAAVDNNNTNNISIRNEPHTLVLAFELMHPACAHPFRRTLIRTLQCFERALQNEKWGEMAMAIKGKHRQSAHPIILLYLY